MIFAGINGSLLPFLFITMTMTDHLSPDAGSGTSIQIILVPQSPCS
jgi:hypothetical protein